MDIPDRALKGSHSYPNYKIKLKLWYILEHRIQPTQSTVDEIKILMDMC